ncbi:MAG: prepilin-type N-terminal cleavage/methylation domain-containing protein [Candidatus Omnitrophota bacterium]|jgi:prepilin-type N-terminal cleavage/methylation domain-containing protein
MPKLSKNNGFTLVELLIVMVVVGILATIATARYTGVLEKGYSAEAYSVLGQIASAENVYRLENDIYAKDIADLDIDTPKSVNFNFSIPSVDLVKGYARAKPKANKGNNTYGMCLRNGKMKSCPGSVNSCSPGCN